MSRKEKIQVAILVAVFLIAILYGGHIDYEFIQAGLIP